MWWMISVVRTVIGVSLFVFSVQAGATKIPDLYEVQIPVVSQERSERLKAIKQGFELLLIRVSGDDTILEKPELSDVIKHSVRYLSRFNYLELPAEHAERINKDLDKSYTQLINLVYDEAVVNNALRMRRLPIWSRVRPAALLWIGIEEGSARTTLSENTHIELVQVINERAKLRGMPLIYPLWDLQDQISVSPSDIFGNFKTNITDASSRYEAESIVVGRISQDPILGTWRGKWSLYIGDDELHWDNEAETYEQVAIRGMDGIANNLASHFAHVRADEQSADYFIYVDGISSLKDYVRTSKYLESLEPIEQFRVERIEPTRATFRVALRTGRSGLEKAVSLSNILVSTVSAEINSAVEQEFHYRLQP